MSLDAIKAKIRKLLRTAANDASTDGEIDNALRAAQALMFANRIDECDLGSDDEPTIPEHYARCKVFTIGRNLSVWECSLGEFICDFFGDINFYSHGGQKHPRENRTCTGVVFYGPADEVQFAGELYHELADEISKTSKLKYGGCFRGRGRSYCRGFTHGLQAKLRQSRKRLDSENKGTALMIVNRNALVLQAGNNWLAEQGIRLGTGTNYAGNYDPSAFAKGVADGKSRNVAADRTRRLTAMLLLALCIPPTAQAQSLVVGRAEGITQNGPQWCVPDDQPVTVTWEINEGGAAREHRGVGGGTMQIGPHFYQFNRLDGRRMSVPGGQEVTMMRQPLGQWRFVVIRGTEGEIMYEPYTPGLECQPFWIVDHFEQVQYLPGDANLDNVFDTADMTQIFQAGFYEVGGPLFEQNAPTWREGDWNADGYFDSSDLTLALQQGTYEGDNPFATAVPEPSAIALFALGIVVLFAGCSSYSAREHQVGRESDGTYFQREEDTHD